MRDQLAGSPNLFTTSFVRESFNALDTRPWWFLPSINALLCQHRVARPLNTKPSLSPELRTSKQLGSAVTIKRLTTTIPPPQKQVFHFSSLVVIALLRKSMALSSYFCHQHQHQVHYADGLLFMTPSVSLVVARLVQTQPTPQACKHHQTGKGPSQASRKVWPSEQTNEENRIATKKLHLKSWWYLITGIC